MEHPILFISVILEALGMPVPHAAPAFGVFWDSHQIFSPHMTYTALVMVEQGIKSQDVASQLRIVPYYRKRFFGQVGKFTSRRLRSLFHELISTDLQLKSTSIDERLLLELLIVKMCGGDKTIAQPVRTA